jgi:hypothetical protein
MQPNLPYPPPFRRNAKDTEDRSDLAEESLLMDSWKRKGQASHKRTRLLYSCYQG